MPLTAKLKTWLVANAGVKANATDDEFREAAAKALIGGELTQEKLSELTVEKDADEANELVSVLKNLSSGFAALQEDLKSLKSAPKSEKGEKDEEDDEEEEEEEEEDEEEKSASKSKPKSKSKPDGKKNVPQHQPSALEQTVKRISSGSMVSDGEKSLDIIVKEAADSYDTTKSAMTYPSAIEKSGRPHPLAGQPVKDFSDRGRVLETPSELERAVTGVWAKFSIASAQYKSRTIAFNHLNQHDKELLYYAMKEFKWGGSSDGGDYADINGKLSADHQKALIDDATSGGLEAAPIVFDDRVIETPLLNGELFPMVNTTPLERGRRVEGVATGTVTASWGGVDDSAISLFNTASYVSAFDTTIYRWEGAIRIGLDFLSDTPIDFGDHVTRQYGERLLEDLDDVIAAGNGTNQPEGVINKSGVTSVAFSGATSLGNYESLRFGVAKAEHTAAGRQSAVFIGTETSYQRAKAIPVGASDARRLGGMDYDSYTWMQRPYKINESLSNQQIAYVILSRYRMYRRRGLVMRASTEGDTLIRNNELLMVAMARYGGQLERGAVAAVTSDAPV